MNLKRTQQTARQAGRIWALAAGLSLAVLGAWLPQQARAQGAAIGQVEYARGAGLAQAPGQAPRVLGKGLPLSEGDRVTTAEGGTAIVALQDGTRMTLRPNSELLVQQYRYQGEGAEGNNMLLALVRGGLRTLTGFITKNAPGAARIQTPTATVGIRGTDFDMRLCSTDCAGEASRAKGAGRPNAVLASAKVVSVQGRIDALDNNGQRRLLVAGGAVYPGEVVETQAATQAVLAFRDDSRVTLGAQTRFRVDHFVYDERNPADGRFLVSLLRGSVRALTGLIAKASQRNVSFTTPTATVGIRGTGLDLDCPDDTCSVFTWLGSIEVTPDQRLGAGLPAQLLQAGQGLFMAQQGIRPISESTLLQLLRPDGVEVDRRSLFGGDQGGEDQPGLYVFVRDGHIELITDRATLQLGRGEAGFANPQGLVDRPGVVPRFIDFDSTPLPGSRNISLVSIIDDLNLRTVNTCR